MYNITHISVNKGKIAAYGSYTDRIILDTKYDDWDKIIWADIGALEDRSVLICELTEPLIVCAGLNGTAVRYGKSPIIRFYIDGTAVGESNISCGMIQPIVLGKGVHALESRVVKTSSHYNVHSSVWALRKHAMPVTKDNMIFAAALTCGNDKQVEPFLESAMLHNIPIRLYDTDKQWLSFFAHKIESFYSNMLQWRSEGIEYVVSCDSLDIVFRAPVEITLGKLNALLDNRIFISTDFRGVLHPLHHFHDPNWLLAQFQKRLGHHCEINTGVIAGRIDHMIEVYAHIIQLRKDMYSGVYFDNVLERVHKEHNNRDSVLQDDQALHFFNMYVHPEWYKLDTEKAFSSFLFAFPRFPSLLQKDENDATCAAPILHASQPSKTRHYKTMVKKRYWDEDNRENIPVLCDLEINITYTCQLKCEYCSHLGRYVKGIVPVNDIRQWCDAWRDKIIPKRYINILGGEPLLHEGVNEILGIVRKTWPTAHINLVTNGLIGKHDDEFVNTVLETVNTVIVSIHYCAAKVDDTINVNVMRWKDRGINIQLRDSVTWWKKFYRLENNKPLPYHSDEKKAFETCPTKHNCMTLLDGRLYKCPQAAMYQYAYKTGAVGEEWKAALDAFSMPASCSQSELAEFVHNVCPASICRMCPEILEDATAEEKANLEGLASPEYLGNLLL